MKLGENMQTEEASPVCSLVVSFRGVKLEQLLVPETTVGAVKASLLEKQQQQASGNVALTASEIKLLCKGRVLKDEEEDLYQTLVGKKVSKSKTFRLVATGISKAEAEERNVRGHELEQQQRRIVRDDLTEEGQRQDMDRRRKGQAMLQRQQRSNQRTPTYGFGGIETLPNLPQRDEAKRILESLAKDPGVLACMAKHKWNVGCLAELYPDGNVGESEVCVMGLNQNKGQKILLRIRTDDLNGFRKPLSIRKVLYHELAHNVHSEHNGDFFQLMRQIEKECTEMDWTNGAGLSTNEETGGSWQAYEGGTFRLGGVDGVSSGRAHLSRREMAAQAALKRAQQQQPESQQSGGAASHVENVECFCGRCLQSNLFLPKDGKQNDANTENDGMDLS